MWQICPVIKSTDKFLLMNLDENTLSNLSVEWTQKHFKAQLSLTQWDLFQKHEGDLAQES